MQEARLSVALVTRNRAASLERTLQSLRSQSVEPWEVVVSDDSDEEKTDRFAKLLPFISANIFAARAVAFTPIATTLRFLVKARTSEPWMTTMNSQAAISKSA